MKRKQLLTLFACNLVGWMFVQPAMNLLPVYAVRLGADQSWAGNILALAFFGLLIGTLLTGILSAVFQRRRLMLFVAGAVNVPAVFLMGRAGDHIELALLTAVVFCCVGVSFTTVSILTGLFASESQRGRIFGILAVNNGLGALIGGAVSGPIADASGFPALFAVGAVWWILQPLVALLMEDRRIQPQPRESSGALPASSGLGAPFYLFLLGTTMGLAATFFAVLGRPLVMDELKFDSTAISGAGAIAGAFSLPFPFIIGWLSDRVGRFWLIVSCFLVGAAGLVALAFAVQLWHFWLASILLAAIGVSIGVGSAFMTDLVPAEKIGWALTLFGFAGPVGGIAGFLFTGNAIRSLGAPQTFLGGALLTLLAIALMIVARPTRLQPAE